MNFLRAQKIFSFSIGKPKHQTAKQWQVFRVTKESSGLHKCVFKSRSNGKRSKQQHGGKPNLQSKHPQKIPSKSKHQKPKTKSERKNRSKIKIQTWALSASCTTRRPTGSGDS